MGNMKFLALFFLASMLLLPIFQCRGQTSGLKITQDQYNWNEDMKRLKITTPDVGLIFKITISNQGDRPIDLSENLFINIHVESTETGMFVNFLRQLEINYLYLPTSENDTRFVKVDFGGGQIRGSYKATLTYNFGSYPTEGQPIGEYPFNFRVLDNDTFQQEIEQNKGGTTINLFPNLHITLFEIGVPVTVVSIVLVAYLWKRKQDDKSGEKGKVKRKGSTSRK